MNTISKRLAIVSLVAFGALGVRAAYLESDAGGTAKRVEPVPPDRIIPPRPRPDLPLTRMVRQLRVGPPYSRYGLTFYPLVLGRGGNRSAVLTLDEAVRRDLLVIREKGSGEVPRVAVRNDAGAPVFLMAGEILLGGRQNRIIRDDVLLPSRSGFVDVPVYCGEQDRWAGGEPAFRSGSSLTAPSLRKMAAESASQDHIWREIDGQLGRADVESSTRSYQGIYEDGELRRRLDECVGGFRDFCRAETVGCVAVCRGRILGGDVFSDADLFSRLWDKICRSYATEVVFPDTWRRSREERDRPWIGGEGADIRRFLGDVLSAGFSDGHTPGLGRYRRIHGAVSGNVLEWRESVVHAGLFPGRVVVMPLR